MSKTVTDLSGLAFGRLTVESRAPDRIQPNGSTKVMWACVCSCGARLVASASNLRSGNTSSCGCLRKEELTARSISHGMTKTAEYNSWFAAKQRCTNPKHQYFYAYGGRGIQMCKEWSDSFEAFFAHMGPKPSPMHSIDRIDVDGNYCPENCRWASPQQQSSNKTNSRMLSAFGTNMCASEWSKLMGVSQQTISSRLRRGFTHEECLTGRQTKGGTSRRADEHREGTPD